MRELSKRELDGLLQFNQSHVLLYFYTPLCGTCKVSTRMLSIVEEAIPNTVIYQCNINFLASYAMRWKITSVPCLIILEKNRIKRKLYTFESVKDLYEQIQKLRG